MNSNNNCSLLIIFSLLLILDLTVARSCPRTCGGVDIPYPFGIGMGCYLEKWYEIICVNNSVPLLSIISKEVVSISFSDMYRRYFNVGYGSIRIKNPITSKGCSSGGEELGSLLNLTGYPFYVGHNNMLIAVGCNNTASLTNVEPSVVGCQSTCSTKHHMPIDNYIAVVYCNAITRGPSEFCSEIRIMNDTRCDGIGCCKASMPDRYQQIVGVRIDDNNTQSRGCKVAFLTDEEYFLSNGSDPQSLYANGYVTVELRWFIHTANQSFLGSLGCKSIEEYTILRGDYREYGIDCLCDYNSPSYATCSCSSGYEGNPYLPGECKDINECIRAIRGIDGENPIYAKGKCVNLQGGYKCAYTNNRPLAIGISTSFGSLIFIGGIYWLYKFIRRQRRLNRKKKFFKRNGGLLLQQQLTSTEGNVENTRVFSSRELEKATENFSLNRILGEGGQGTVYKGMLVDGRIVAVKKSKVVDEDKLEEFINEVVILSKINHRNIVKLLGCCLETDVPIRIHS